MLVDLFTDILLKLGELGAVPSNHCKSSALTEEIISDSFILVSESPFEGIELVTTWSVSVLLSFRWLSSFKIRWFFFFVKVFLSRKGVEGADGEVESSCSRLSSKGKILNSLHAVSSPENPLPPPLLLFSSSLALELLMVTVDE